jgi:branched-chain amino acid transport system permease protein
MSTFVQQVLNGLAWGSVYALIALGYTMVYGVLKLINFAHGEVYMMGAMAGYYVGRWAQKAELPMPLRLPVTLLGAMAACAVLGFLIERFAYRPLRQANRLSVLITAIGVSLLLQNGGQLVFGADPKYFPQVLSYSEVVNTGGVVLSNIQLVIMVTAVALMAALNLFVQKTRSGRAMRAVANDKAAAQLVGISVDRIISLTFVIGSVLAAAAGVLVGLSNPKVDPLMGIMPGLKAFVAAVLGGIGNIPGAMLGGVLLGLVETLVSAIGLSTYRDAIAFALLIGFLLFKPTGLMGRPDVEKV